MEAVLAETLAGWRRHLHAHPAVTLSEAPTAAFVAERLRELGVPFEAAIGGHGIVATLQRPGPGGNRAVGLRGDMDALPIAEANDDLPHRSTVPGVMHACGHDGHTVALLGAAALLARDESWSGTVRFVFQPAEEGGHGARSMIADGLFERFPMERIFGWHNWPGLAAGTIAVHDAAVMAAGARFEIVFEGHAGHAALPHLARDPMIALGEAIGALQSVVSRSVDPLDAAVVSITIAEAGEAINQVPRRATLRGTARWLRPEVGATIDAAMRRIVEGIAAAHGLTVAFTLRQGIPITINHPGEREVAAAAAAEVTTLRRDLPPALTGEDFSWYLDRVPGAFVWIGNGPADGGRELHSPHYDFNDAILPVASNWLATVAKRALAG